jgi:protein-S-isoprenylcysteine O-methyltransferase Ste14
VRHTLGSVLVALQFGLIVLLAGLGLPSFLSDQAPAGAWITSAVGAFVGVWAVSSNRPGNFNIRPVPRAGARLIEEGPYRWIRHPMYTAVMACGGAAAWASATWLAWLALGALVAVLVSKAVLEERWLLLAHPGYADYQKGTRWFLPWIA